MSYLPAKPEFETVEELNKKIGIPQLCRANGVRLNYANYYTPSESLKFGESPIKLVEDLVEDLAEDLTIPPTLNRQNTTIQSAKQCVKCGELPMENALICKECMMTMPINKIPKYDKDIKALVLDPQDDILDPNQMGLMEPPPLECHNSVILYVINKGERHPAYEPFEEIPLNAYA